MGLNAGTLESSLKDKLSRAIFEFSRNIATCTTGALCQIWMPEVTREGDVVLSAQGLPFSLAGVGDLLALFRCVSCRYRFATVADKPELMGAIGRVYCSSEPEMTNNLQKYDKQVYLRVSEAQRCRVHSTLVMPVFVDASRTRAVAVVELVQSDKDVAFPRMMAGLRNCLKAEGLATCDVPGAGGKDSPGLESMDLMHELGAALGAAPSHSGTSGKGRLSPANDELQDAAGTAGPERSGDSSSAAGPGRAAPCDHGLGDGTPRRAEEAMGETSQPLVPDRTNSSARPPVGAAPLNGSAGPAAGSGGDPSAAAAAAVAAAAAANPQLVVQMLQAITQQQHQQPQPPAGPPQLLQRLQMPLLAQQPTQQGQPLPQLSARPPQQQPLVVKSEDKAAVAAKGGDGVAVAPPSSGVQRAARAASGRAARAAAAAARAEEGEEEEDDDDADFDGSDDDEPRRGGAGGGRHPSHLGAGRRLTYDDLATQFGTGLKQAAANLGICPTTLKRACRRNGITRWPRRQIAKLSRTLTQMGYPGEPPKELLRSAAKGNISKAMAQLANTGALPVRSGNGSGSGSVADGTVGAGISAAAAAGGVGAFPGLLLHHEGASGAATTSATSSGAGTAVFGVGGVGGSVHGGVGGSLHGGALFSMSASAPEALHSLQPHSFPGAMGLASAMPMGGMLAISGPPHGAFGADRPPPPATMLSAPHAASGIMGMVPGDAMLAAAPAGGSAACVPPHASLEAMMMAELEAPSTMDGLMVDLINEDMLLSDGQLSEGDMDILAALGGGGGGGGGASSLNGHDAPGGAQHAPPRPGSSQVTAS